MKDKVVLNNSQVKDKKTKVEDHPRISSISNKTKSITACNDSLKFKTLNVNVVYATCGKCVFNSNHDELVFLNRSNLSSIPSSSNSLADCSTHPIHCTVHFDNDQFALILSYGDLVQGSIMINRVYYVEGLNHNLFSVGQFCDANLEVAFRKSTCFVRDLQGNDLLIEEGIEHQTSTPRTPKQNGVVERRNRTLVEAARTMLSASKLPLFFWAEAIATACYTQNRSIIILTQEKTAYAYHIINDRKPSIKHLHIFGFTCYLTRDGENLDKMKEKRDLCILVGYSTQSKGCCVYNKRTRLIVESINLRFDEIKEMSKTSVDNNTSGLIPQRQKVSDYDNSSPAPQLQNVSPSADTTAPSQ
ncbi:retrovirus-related pol polyprotein from transposon TNT 1-94 [Tanacetum coccineum]|uniref:Retrovirus-related pol polyprotein from transposon TNT 1-94 n=1 Tax=Tanacetum coccineum TaxID=301880 RepID=A0ABQ5F3S1_9ASTR